MNRHLCIWLPNCPTHNEPANKPANDAALESVAQQIGQQICPLVAIETLDKKPWAGQTEHRAESLLCDITGVAHLFGDEAGMLGTVDELLASMKIDGRIAIADSVGAAWAVSHYANPGGRGSARAKEVGASSNDSDSPRPASGCGAGGEGPCAGIIADSSERRARFRPLTPDPSPPRSAGERGARVSSLGGSTEIPTCSLMHRFVGPALPSRIVPPGGNRRAIEPLPIESLRIAEETAATLSRLGVHFVGQLLCLPRSGLAPRLGKPLLRRIEQALGEVDEAIEVYRPPVQHVAAHRLEYSTSDQKILADRIERLIKEVRAGMATCQRGALRITCRLDLTDHPPLTLGVGLFAPTIDAEHLCGLLINRFETTRLPSPVQRLTLSVPLTGPLRSTQNPLFAKDSNEATFSSQKSNTKEISRLVDSLSARLGCDSVVGVKLKDNPLPEKAFAVSPLTGTGSSHSSRNFSTRSFPSHNAPSHNAPSSWDAMRRPLSLLVEPISIAVATDHGPFRFVVSSLDVPQRIRIGGTAHWVVRSWGSERIETSWWNGPSIRRDYYRIETDSAHWWWIFRDLASKADGYRWMLHGRFD
jgi:protein ImuB